MICSVAFKNISHTIFLQPSKRIAIIFFFLWLSIPSFAQDQPLNYRTVEESTYNFYQYKEWEKLIERGNKALEQDIDYFYLRLRLGIAYFNKGNYFLASTHLEKAFKFNSTNQTALEYLYLAYQYTNRATDANRTRSFFTGELREKYPGKVLNNLYLQSGPILSNNISRNKEESLLNGKHLSAQQDLNDSKYFNQAGLEIHPFKNIALVFNYSNLRTQKLKQIEASELVKTGTTTIQFVLVFEFADCCN
jgi:tetratricopeptide (TPR) repeat protein